MTDHSERAQALATAIESAPVNEADPSAARAGWIIVSLRSLGFEVVAREDLSEALAWAGRAPEEADALASQLYRHLRGRSLDD